MDVAVEISFYPLRPDYRACIHDFLERLRAEPQLRIVTNSMSTQVSGGCEHVLATLGRHLQASFERLGQEASRGVFVLKVLGPLTDGASAAATAARA